MEDNQSFRPLTNEEFVDLVAPLIGAARTAQATNFPLATNSKKAAELLKAISDSDQGETGQGTNENFAQAMWDNYVVPVRNENKIGRYAECLAAGGDSDACAEEAELNSDQYEPRKPKGGNPEDDGGLPVPIYQSPLVLDLDGDGIETTTIESGQYVDADEDDLSTKQSWISSDDGFLVIDKNMDGKISGTEFFGETSVLSSGEIAENGFQALADYDSNGDGRIDSTDIDFGNLLIFRDLNSDGHAADNELFSLSEMQISQLELSFSDGEVDERGNDVRYVSSYSLVSGETLELSDVYFQIDYFDVIENDSSYVNLQFSHPNTEALGGLHSVYYSIAEGNSEVEGLMSDYQSESGYMARRDIVVDLLYSLAGVKNVNPNDYVDYASIDVRALLVLEKVYSVDIDTSRNIANQEDYQSSFDSIVDYYYYQLESKNSSTSPFDLISYDEMSSEGSGFDFSYALMDIFSRVKSDPADSLDELYGFMHAVNGISAFDSETYLQLWGDLGYLSASIKVNSSLSDFFGSFAEKFLDQTISSSFYDVARGSGSDDVLTFSSHGQDLDLLVDGRDGDDTIEGNFLHNNVLFGGAGNDTIMTAASSYTLTADQSNDIIGGQGNDTLNGFYGSDTYHFNRGDGQDLILDRGGVDRIVFGEDISVSDVTFSSLYNDLVITIMDPSNPSISDRITIREARGGSSQNYQIEALQFASGEVITSAEMMQFASNVELTEEADAYTTSEFFDDTVRSLGGNDNIRLLGGNDIVYAGEGDDLVLLTGATVNAQIFGEGGNDTLEAQSYGSFVHIDGGEGNDHIEGGRFADNTLLGGAGNDTIMAAASSYTQTADHSNSITGGLGNDTLYGFYGSDTYHFNRGDGQDTLRDYGSSYNKSDRIVFGEGILVSDVTFSGLNNDLVITITDSNNPGANDQITVKDARGVSAQYYQIEELQFASGEVITSAEMMESASNVELSEEADTYTTSQYFDDTVHSLGGDDTIRVKGGNDIVYAGEGDDLVQLTGATVNAQIFGEGGNDRLEAQSYGSLVHIDGGEGNDHIEGGRFADNTLLGGAGNDTIMAAASSYTQTADHSNDITGGQGNDTLYGFYGSDTFHFNQGDGQDTLRDDGGSYSNTDQIVFGEGLSSDNLWLSKSGDNLLIDVIGTNDQITVKNWYTGSRYHVEEIHASDAVLASNMVDQLVNAMAAFDAPSGVGAVVPQEVRDQLNPILASSWG